MTIPGYQINPATRRVRFSAHVPAVYGGRRRRPGWFSRAHVAVTHLGDEVGSVSTIFVFLDQDLNAPSDAPSPRPLVFETMVFRRGREIRVEHSSRWRRAERIHGRMVRWLRRQKGNR